MSLSWKPAPLVRNGRGSRPAEAAKTRNPGWASISGTTLLHAHPIDYGYGTAVPDIVKWSSVIKATLQPLHPNTLTSGSPSTPGIVRVRIIGREQFGQSGDRGCIFPTDRTRVSLMGCNASPMQCFHRHQRTVGCEDYRMAALWAAHLNRPVCPLWISSRHLTPVLQ